LAKYTSGRSGGGELSTIIGADATLQGNLEVKASLRVDGRIKGELVSTEMATIGEGGIVDGNISAKDIVVGGKVIGKLNASGKVVLEEKAVLLGDIRTSRLVVEEGAVFDGHSDMGGEKHSQPVHSPKKINLEDDNS